MDEPRQNEPPAVPEPAPGEVAPVDTELDAAVAAFDAAEQTRTMQARPLYEPFSLRDVDRRVWIGVGILGVLIGIGLGGPPWDWGFWVALAAVLLVMFPIAGAAVFFWKREM
jgi:hypothetical protein